MLLHLMVPRLMRLATWLLPINTSSPKPRNLRPSSRLLQLFRAKYNMAKEHLVRRLISLPLRSGWSAVERYRLAGLG